MTHHCDLRTLSQKFHRLRGIRQLNHAGRPVDLVAKPRPWPNGFTQSQERVAQQLTIGQRTMTTKEK